MTNRKRVSARAAGRAVGRPVGRRGMLAAGLGSLAVGSSGNWLTQLAQVLGQQQQVADPGRPARSLIVLWMQGGPSQLETFDPHPGSTIAAGSEAIKTAVSGVHISDGLPRLAERMDQVSLVRSIVSKEGDHERASYYVKNGFTPQPTVVHPSIGAVICHHFPDMVEIPRHVSILPSQWPGRGGYLGDQFDAFQMGDPNRPIPDVVATVPASRARRRFSDLVNVVEAEFARGRLSRMDEKKTLHQASMKQALTMMGSEQLKAFDISQEPLEVQRAFGDTPFGRSCLAACRLVAEGVRCVEITLSGWDTHVNNHELTSQLNEVQDRAFAALLDTLQQRQLLKSTVVMWGGEFGRTPRLNRFEGRDHWPHGFTMALAGGGIRGGQVVGETSPQPDLTSRRPADNVDKPTSVDQVHATALAALGVQLDELLYTPAGRPMKINEAAPLEKLLLS